MNDIVERLDDVDSGEIIRAEDAQYDLYFKIHQRVNAKSEEISKSYKNNILVEFSDIQELHQKTVQSIKSLKPVSSSLSERVEVYHNEGEAEKFNSFDDFQKYNLTSPSPTAQVSLIYRFVIFDSESGEFENYRVSAEVRSRVAELKQIEKEAPAFLSKALISSLVTQTARISIRYSDYVKARHFTAMFDEWVKGCDEAKSIKHINKMKKVSHLLTAYGKLIILFFLAFFTVISLRSESAELNISLALQFFVIYSAVFVTVGNLASLFLGRIESSIDSYLSLSYIKINKGDNKAIRQYSGRNKYSLAWGVVGFIGTVGVGVLASATYDLIKSFLQI